MATLKEFEDLLRQHGMTNALAILDGLRTRDREKRSVAPARRVVGRKMTAELARSILELHATTGMTQQEIAFRLGVNQGRVNEVIKRGKWLSADPGAPEALSRDKAMDRLKQRARDRRTRANSVAPGVSTVVSRPAQADPQLTPGLPQADLPSMGLLLEGTEGDRSAQGASSLRPPQPVVSPQAKARPPAPRMPPPPPAPIVSAQLAFLDL